MVSPKTSALRKFIFSTNLESSISRLETNKSDSDWLYLSPFPSLTASFCQNERVTLDSHFTSVDNSTSPVRFILFCWVMVPKLDFMSVSIFYVLYGLFFFIFVVNY